jgi:NAD(P)-dependent dehydrogenase (short-subunit alcohol dehydrogenase family)
MKKRIKSGGSTQARNRLRNRGRSSRSLYADPDDMAAIVLFLCSPAARMINGAVIVADAAATQLNWPILDGMLDRGVAEKLV